MADRGISQFWTNVFPSELQAKHQKEIARFEKIVKWLPWFEWMFALVPLKISLKLFGFSDE